MICKSCGKETVTRFCQNCGTENIVEQPVMNNQMNGNQPVVNNQMYGGHPMMNNQMYGAQPVMNNQVYGGQPVMNNQMYGNQQYTFPPLKKHPYHVGVGYIMCILALIVGTVALFLDVATSSERIINVNMPLFEYPDGKIVAVLLVLGLIFTLCYLPVMSLVDGILLLGIALLEIIDFSDNLSSYVDMGLIGWGPSLFVLLGASIFMIIGGIVYIIEKRKRVVFVPR